MAVLVLGVACLVAAPPAQADELRDQFRARTRTGQRVRTLLSPLGRLLADQMSRAVPVTSGSPGVTFRFDYASGAFERETEVLGQLFVEQAKTIGRGKWNVRMNWSYIDFRSIDGMDLDDLHDTHPPMVTDVGGIQGTVRVPKLSLGIVTNQVTTSATVGLTDDLDLDLTIPVLYTELDFALRLKPTGAPLQQDDEALDHFGIGDILLRAKYRLLYGDHGTVAAGLQLRFPTGSRGDFQGTGVFEVSPALYATSRAYPLGGPFSIRGHVNAFVDFNTNDVARSQARASLGLDLHIGSRATLGLAFLAREPFAKIGGPGTFDWPRCRANPATGACDGPITYAPVFGLSRGRPSFYDLAIGGRTLLWRDTLIGFVSVLVPLNDDGFRAEAIPIVGIEAAF
ncbi:MAG: transporter [bacterium]|nr:transporter [bacterium]